MAVCRVNADGSFECGTGSWTGPKPGDPDLNNIFLQAAGTFGGIELKWTWPGINPGAVAFTIVWRSLQNDFDTAYKIANAQGDYYLDRIDTTLDLKTKYYYWIQIVSIHETVGDVIGPASATAMPLIGQMMDMLSAKIDAGWLATTLRTEIDQIGLNKLGITQEEIRRAENDLGLAVRIEELAAMTEEGRSVLQEEIRLRVDADGALVQTVNTMYSEFGDTIAAIQFENTTFAGELEAMAESLQTVQVTLDGNTASGQVGLISQIETINGKVTTIGAGWTARVDVNGLVGGFGVYNDGRTVEAGFNVNTFWVGTSGDNKRKPFIIHNGITYIDDAAIRQLTFEKLRSEDGKLAFKDGKLQAEFIAVDQLSVNAIQSDNFLSGVRGWAFRPDGTFELNGNQSGGRMIITPSLIRIFDTNGVMRVRMGVW